VLLDPDRGSRTPDKWLSTIIWGQPGYIRFDGTPVQRASDLGRFNVPLDRLINPSEVNPGNTLSAKETELLFLGNDLGSFLDEWIENPYYGSRLPPFDH
jgi:hypothetical protein